MSAIGKPCVFELLGYLPQYGVRHIVVSPGSRNAPLNITAFNRPDITVHTIIDERVAGFVALGMASRGEPVALICTSGSAVLNYGPAVAEAYYRRVPLIVISADRPANSIDQRQGQTIRQPNIFANIVRKSINLGEYDDPNYRKLLVQDALYAATGNIPGPVHINVGLSEPLTAEIWDAIEEDIMIPRVVCLQATAPDYDALTKVFDTLNACGRVMITVGPRRPLTFGENFAKAGNIVVVAEAAANVRGIPTINPFVFDTHSLGRKYCPDIVINIGGAIISNRLKRYFNANNVSVITVGFDDNFVETFGILRARVEIEPQHFLDCWHLQLGTKGHSRAYRNWWMQHQLPMIPDHWCDIKAIELLNANVDKETYLFLANGMSIRHAQFFNWDVAEVFANRGVNGIDGCTSTAAGLAMSTDKDVLLITGDMGAAYDIAALALPELRANLKIAVLDNGGGDIFRHISCTKPFMNSAAAKMLVAEPNLPLKKIAGAYDFAYYKAESITEAQNTIPAFLKECHRPAILHIKTTIQANQKALDLLYHR